VKNLCVREAYEKDGNEVVRWNKIGVLFEKGDKQYVRLFHMPGVLISVFEPKPKDDAEGSWQG
jgi:hypothetical protein